MKNLLALEEFSVEDDFFSLGLDSLVVIQLLSRMSSYNYNLEAIDIYDNATIRQLAQLIRKKERRLSSGNLINKESINIQNSLETSILNGHLPRLDSAALSYVPFGSQLQLKDNMPLLYNYIETCFGNIGVILLPILWHELFSQKDRLLSLCTAAISQAEKLGAGVISLTGLLPSATNYGEDIVRCIDSNARITVGLPTIASSFILALNKLLIDTGRDIKHEKITFLGMDNIGRSVIRLLMSLYPSINKITICDIYKNIEDMFLVKESLNKNNNVEISILCIAHNQLPAEIYQSSIIIYAINIPNIINIDLLRPGTLLLGVSEPDCFSKEKAVQRLKKDEDILFTEGGSISTEKKLKKHVYIPQNINSGILNQFYRHLYQDNEITGCILSSILIAKHSELKPIIGGVPDCDQIIKHYDILLKNEFNAASFRCGQYTIPESTIGNFKQRFMNIS